MPNAKQVLIAVKSYKPFLEPFPPAVAAYSAHYREYPKSLRSVESFSEWLRQMGIGAVVCQKLPLKPLAVKAGLGVSRRNSLVYSEASGSFMTLFGVVIDTEIGEDTPAVEFSNAAPSDCALCNTCVNQCPTGAIMPRGAIDLTRCIRDYMGSGRIVPSEIRKAYGVRLIGCEICQRVCPKNAHVLKNLSLPPREELEMFSLANLLDLNKPAWKVALENISGVIGKNYARKNRILGDAVIAAGNTKDPSLLKFLRDTLKYPHVPVRAHSAWAVGRIGTPDAEKILTNAFREEEDPQVLSEIKAALEEVC